MGRVNRRVGLIVLEGGHPAPADPVASCMLAVRRALTLDLLERGLAAGAFDVVVLCSDDAELLTSAAALGCATLVTGPEFSFSRVLARAVEEQRLEAVVCMGGAACPLAAAADLRDWAAFVREHDQVCLVNNPMSPDVVAFHPARLIAHLQPPPAADNELGEALRASGLRRVLMPNSPRVNFDVDTPTDVLILAVVGAQGPRTRSVLAELAWDASRLKSARAVLERRGAEVALIGRVAPTVVAYLNAHFPIRVRVLSEERGMKALRREEAGSVYALAGAWIADVGPTRFFAHLARAADAAFIDSRPILAHAGRRVGVRDRCLSDLGRWQGIDDAFTREFTRAAVSAPIPVVLGGHTLVYGGLWALAADVLARRLLAPDPS